MYLRGAVLLGHMCGDITLHLSPQIPSQISLKTVYTKKFLFCFTIKYISQLITMKVFQKRLLLCMEEMMNWVSI